MQYVGIDWAYRRAAWCAKQADGTIFGEGLVPADEDGLARLVIELGPEVRACLEMMSGAAWVRDRLAGAGWQVEVADARKVKKCRPARVQDRGRRPRARRALRELVPALWIPSLEERKLRERLKRRLHLVRLRTSAKNRVFGLLTQWGLRIPCDRLRRPDAMELLETRGVPEVWRRSVGEAVAVIELLDERIAALDRELGPLARADRRVCLLGTIPGIGPLLGLTIAAEIGDVARFQSPRKLIGYSGLAPRVKQSGQRSRPGELSKAGSRTLRFAAVEAAQGAWRETNPWHRLYADVQARTGKANPAKSAVARKVLIACWHGLSREQPFKPRHPKPILARPAPPAFWPPDGPHAN